MIKKELSALVDKINSLKSSYKEWGLSEEETRVKIFQIMFPSSPVKECSNLQQSLKELLDKQMKNQSSFSNLVKSLLIRLDLAIHSNTFVEVEVKKSPQKKKEKSKKKNKNKQQNNNLQSKVNIKNDELQKLMFFKMLLEKNTFYQNSALPNYFTVKQNLFPVLQIENINEPFIV